MTKFIKLNKKHMRNIIKTLLIILTLITFGCSKDDTVIPLRTVDVVGYGDNNFNLSVRLASWDTDTWLNSTQCDSTTIRLTYVQCPDTLFVKTDGNHVKVYSNNELQIDTTSSQTISIRVIIK